MFSALSRTVFQQLARSPRLQRLASRHGMAKEQGFARRFIAGETVDQAIQAIAGLPDRGFLVTLDYLGESVRSGEAAAAAASEYVAVLNRMIASGVERNVSVKLTQLGLDVDFATAVDNIRHILETADANEFFVRIDMEDSQHTSGTLRVLEALWQHGHRRVGTVVQSYLKRAEADVRKLNGMGVRVRLVKGAYQEPKTVAFQDKAVVDASFVELMRLLLDEGHYPAIATHDPAMIAATKAHALAKGYAKDRFEFQMLYGIRRDLQAALVAEGYRVRIYVPFGKQWYPYFMRRLGERPANVGFVLRSLVRDRG